MGSSYKILYVILQTFKVHLAEYLLKKKMLQTEVIDMFCDHYTFLQVLSYKNNKLKETDSLLLFCCVYIC